MTPTFHGEETQVMDAPFMDEVIWVRKPVLGSDLIRI